MHSIVFKRLVVFELLAVKEEVLISHRHTLLGLYLGLDCCDCVG